MRKIITTFIIVCATGIAWSLDIDPFKGPKPIAVMIQTDPWLMVVGSDTPIVAIYDDGRLIYVKKDKDKNPVYFYKQLSANELAGIKKRLASFGDYSKLKRYYDLTPAVTDLPETEIYLSLGKTELTTRVYGLTRSGAKQSAHTAFGSEQKPNELPKTISELHAYLASLVFNDARPWEPEYVEVMIWRFDNAPGKPIPWPKDWPGLESPNTLKRGDSYSIFLPGKELPKLRTLLKARKETSAVEIDGKKWAVSIRYAFPSEPVWNNAFRQK